MGLRPTTEHKKLADRSFLLDFLYPRRYFTEKMIQVRKTEEFDKWLHGLRDVRAFAQIARRINRVIQGNIGDCKFIGDKIYELRVDYGPGYRLYFTQRGKQLVLLLIGGDKSSQRRDIELAKTLAKEYGE